MISSFVYATAEVTKNGWFDIPAPWLALFGTIFGGVGLKIVESWLNNPTKRDSTPAELREELRTQIEGLKEDVDRRERVIDELELEVDAWREKYWQLIAEHNKQQRQLLDYLSELQQLRSEIQEKNVGRGQ